MSPERAGCWVERGVTKEGILSCLTLFRLPCWPQFWPQICKYAISFFMELNGKVWCPPGSPVLNFIIGSSWTEPDLLRADTAALYSCCIYLYDSEVTYSALDQAGSLYRIKVLGTGELWVLVIPLPLQQFPPFVSNEVIPGSLRAKCHHWWLPGWAGLCSLHESIASLL